MNDFYKDLARGRQGEVLVANAFRDMGYEVTDVTKDSSYWNKDIDLIINDNGTDRLIEVKSDWSIASTGNVVIELNKTYHPEKKGWFYYTESTHLAFVDMRNKIAYIARTNELKEYVEKNKYRTINLNNYECGLISVELCDCFQKVAV